MEIGKLRARIEIQSYTEIQSGGHNTYKKWTTVKNVWADIDPVKGLVTLDTKQIGEKVTHKITIRYQPFITTEHWIYFNSRRYRIRSVRNLQERNRFLELLCEEDSIAIDEFEVGVEKVGDPLREDLG
jgi:SPP1 family predicted phage head-tail adaptor